MNKDNAAKEGTLIGVSVKGNVSGMFRPLQLGRVDKGRNRAVYIPVVPLTRFWTIGGILMIWDCHRVWNCLRRVSAIPYAN